MSSLGLCGEDSAVTEASKWAFSLCFKCHLEVGLFLNVSEEAVFTLLSVFVSSFNCIPIAYVT